MAKISFLLLCCFIVSAKDHILFGGCSLDSSFLNFLCLDVVRESDPANNVPDSIFSKIGLQLHRRDNHPIGILKNTIYDYFDTNFPAKFAKFDDLCPIVSVKQVFLQMMMSFWISIDTVFVRCS